MLGEDLDERHVAALRRDVRGRLLPALGERRQHRLKPPISTTPKKPKTAVTFRRNLACGCKTSGFRGVRAGLHEQPHCVVVLVVGVARRGEHRAVPEAVATSDRLRGAVLEQRLDDLLLPAALRRHRRIVQRARADLGVAGIRVFRVALEKEVDVLVLARDHGALACTAGSRGATPSQLS